MRHPRKLSLIKCLRVIVSAPIAGQMPQLCGPENARSDAPIHDHRTAPIARQGPGRLMGQNQTCRRDAVRQAIARQVQKGAIARVVFDHVIEDIGVV